MTASPRDGLVYPAGRNFRAGQHADELRGPFRRPVAVTGKEDRGAVQAGPGGSSSLIVKASDGRAYVALTNRKAPQVAALNVRVFLNGS
jgi:hypothetical protein